MSDLVVRPSYVFSENDILTVDKLNLMATPVVELAIQDPVNDQNFLRNGNFYSSFWTTPDGMTHPPDLDTSNADYWRVGPVGAEIISKRSLLVPDTKSLFSCELDGAVSVTDVWFGQNINGDLSATLRRNCTFSGYIYNSTGVTSSPKLEIYTCDAFNNFALISSVALVDLQTCASGVWTYVSATLDLSTFANVINGITVSVKFPSGILSAVGNNITLSRLKFQIGEIATEFVDDVGIFIQTPSVDSTMLQDGCIARPALFLPDVVPTGAYQAKSINNGDINDGQIDGRTIAAGAVAVNLGYEPINKAGDTLIGPGPLEFENEIPVGAVGLYNSSMLVSGTSAHGANDGYMPSIAFNRPGTFARAIGLSVNGRFKTVDYQGTVGYLLDSVTRVATADVQDKAITLAKLADEVINMIIPAGIMAFFGGGAYPSGWLACDGSAVNRTTYAKLFAAIGTYWGSGDNISTFNLPDLRGRAPIGYVNSAAPGITARGFGTRGGEETHTLSVDEMPYHDHAYAQTAHDHGTHAHSYTNPQGTTINLQGGSTPLFYPSGAAATSGSAVPASYANITFNGQGGSVAHNVMQPYAVGFWIVKV